MIKNYILIGLIVIVAILGIFSYISVFNNNKLKQKWSISENNYKASLSKNLAYQLTIDQLKNSNDSIDNELLKFKKKLKIKDSKINSLMQIIEVGVKTDTINYPDTIFVPKLNLDTIIGDEWIQTRLQLKYPSRIIKTDSINNRKNIIWSNRKETIDAPNKCFLIRLFQKKQTVVEINIEDLNPYFKTKEFKYITIIK